MSLKPKHEQAITTEEVNIRLIRHGDCVIHEGRQMTVCAKDIKWCPLMGVSIFGDCYHLGYKKVKRMVFPSLPTSTH